MAPRRHRRVDERGQVRTIYCRDDALWARVQAYAAGADMSVSSLIEFSLLEMFAALEGESLPVWFLAAARRLQKERG